MRRTYSYIYDLRLQSVDKSLGEIAIGVDAAVAQERPPTPNLFRALEINVDDCRIFVVVRGAVDEFALRTCYETAAPELDAVGSS